MSERLVVFAPNWLGDAVMALPAVADIRRHFPSAHLGVAARAAVAPMFSMVEGVDEVVVLPDEMHALSEHAFDTAILFPNSFSTARLARKAGIPASCIIC